jgi:HEAT repeat protein
MGTNKTLGRRPTFGEVLEYYTHDDFLQFLLDTCRTRLVVMIISQHRHWEPNWREDIVRAKDKARLKQYILDKLLQNLPEVHPGDRLSYYPSFHQSIGKWPTGTAPVLRGKNKAPRMREHDCIFEADLLTWRDSFRDVSPILDLMERHGVCYRHKFSGHRSLHVVIPSRVLPKGYRGQATRKLAHRLTAWGGSRAHHLSMITRMPYSLNEDTGLVCVPIARGELSTFRPWQASHHLVEIGKVWEESITEDDRDRMRTLLDTLSAHESVEKVVSGGRFLIPDKAKTVSKYRGQVSNLAGKDPVGSAWQLLVGDHELSEQMLLEGLESSELDARWLTVEAFLLGGTSLSREGILKLLAQEDEYTHSSAVDVLLRFEEDVIPHLLQVIGDLDNNPQMGARAVHLLTQSDTPRRMVIDASAGLAGRSRDVLFVAACSVGSMAGDWSEAFRLLEGIRRATDLSERDRAKLAALTLMSTMGGWDIEIGWHPKEESKKQRALARLAPYVTDLLLIAAESPNPAFREGIIAALAMTADERAVDVLVRSLDHDFAALRRKVISGLVRIGGAAVEPLISAAASDQADMRQHAVFCLGRIGDRRAKPTFLESLDDSETKIRRYAIKALRDMATVDDVERFKQVLREETWENAMLAAEVMESIGDEGKQALLEMALNERNPAAAYSVALNGNPRGREVLVEWLSEEDGRRKDAVEFLRELGDERCISFLAEELKTATGERGRSIALELGRIGSEAAVKALIEALSADNRLTRRGAIRALEEIGDPTSVEPLIRCLAGDDDPKVQRLAATALAAIGEAVEGPLRKALEENRIRGNRRQNQVKRVLWKLGVSI